MKTSLFANSDRGYTTTVSMVAAFFLCAAVIVVLNFAFVYTARAASLSQELSLGMSGADVSNLQTFLAADRTLYPEGIVTGYYGSLTQAAVARFQTRNGLPAVGRVGPLTLAALNAQMSGMVGTGDINAPMISGLSVGTSANSASFNWVTNESSTATVYYSTSPMSMVEGSATTGVMIGGSAVPIHTDFRTAHGATLSGFQPNTTYYYVVYVRDAAGNESITWPATFKTAL